MGNNRFFWVAIIALFFFHTTSNAAAEDGKPEVPSQEQIDLNQMLFADSKDLNTSLAVRKEHGRLYLVIEVDHNFNKNAFMLSLGALGIGQGDVVQVLKGKQAFGFNNKFIALFPVIETAGEVDSKHLLYELNSVEHRTQQQLDLTELLERASESNLLVDAEGKAYKVSDIHEFSFLMGVERKGHPKTIEHLNVDIDTLKEGETQMVYGETQVTALAIQPPMSEVNQKMTLSMEVVLRYFQPIIMELQEGVLGLDRLDKISKTLRALPMELSEERIKVLSEKIHHTEAPAEILQLIMFEQMKSNYEGPQVRCHKLF